MLILIQAFCIHSPECQKRFPESRNHIFASQPVGICCMLHVKQYFEFHMLRRSVLYAGVPFASVNLNHVTT